MGIIWYEAYHHGQGGNFHAPAFYHQRISDKPVEDDDGPSTHGVGLEIT